MIKALDGPMDAPRGGRSNTAMNTEIFIRIYRKMFELGTATFDLPDRVGPFPTHFTTPLAPCDRPSLAPMLFGC